MKYEKLYIHHKLIQIYCTSKLSFEIPGY